MSIVIKGLSCPKSCLECKFRRSYSADFPWEECYCMFTFDRIAFIEQKLDNCPIEPLEMSDPVYLLGKNDLQEYINEQMENGEFEKEFNKQRKRFEKIMAKIKKRK